MSLLEKGFLEPPSFSLSTEYLLALLTGFMNEGFLELPSDSLFTDDLLDLLAGLLDDGPLDELLVFLGSLLEEASLVRDFIDLSLDELLRFLKRLLEEGSLERDFIDLSLDELLRFLRSLLEEVFFERDLIDLSLDELLALLTRLPEDGSLERDLSLDEFLILLRRCSLSISFSFDDLLRTRCLDGDFVELLSLSLPLDELLVLPARLLPDEGRLNEDFLVTSFSLNEDGNLFTKLRWAQLGLLGLFWPLS